LPGFCQQTRLNILQDGHAGELTLKRLLLMAPLALAGACTTEDLDAFAYGLNEFSYELDYQLNPPCPDGMYRQFVAQTLVTTYPEYSYQQVGYQMAPGGYSYCAYPIVVPYYDDHQDHHDWRDRHEDRDYREGYRDGYHDGQHDN
jgi:hypothetical protein